MSSEQEQLDAAIAASLQDVELSKVRTGRPTLSPAPKQPANALLKQLAQERKQRQLNGEQTRKNFLQPKQEADDLMNTSYMSEEDQLFHAMNLSLMAADDAKLPAPPRTPPRGNPQERPTPSPQKRPASKVKAIVVRSTTAGSGEEIYAGTKNDTGFVNKALDKAIPGIKITNIDADTPAKGKSMGEEIESVVSRATRTNNHIILYYTGHGNMEDGSLDLRRNSNMSPKRFISEWLKVGKGKKVTLIVDACFSGNWIKEFSSLPEEDLDGLKVEIFTSSSAKTTSTSQNNNFQVAGKKVRAGSRLAPKVSVNNSMQELRKYAADLGVDGSAGKSGYG
ncbi:hypothetical protein TrLO_g12009 [Triparma laevis f. longispina]|uniref:Uncharacterized protein n=1 Tax=Triparma laevis f. longispina TaxID=1714387 RepID=A0A9W7CDJ5_9STRA|nr:hypothetical protein TrLO_g12009 [Triparma laevis f. longispina]